MSSSQCPMCFENFPASAIERHASNCKGKKVLKSSDATPTATRTSPWSGFKRRRSDAGNGGGENESPKSAKLDKKEEQEADASASVNRKDWFLAFFGYVLLSCSKHTGTMHYVLNIYVPYFMFISVIILPKTTTAFRPSRLKRSSGRNDETQISRRLRGSRVGCRRRKRLAQTHRPGHDPLHGPLGSAGMRKDQPGQHHSPEVQGEQGSVAL